MKKSFLEIEMNYFNSLWIIKCEEERLDEGISRVRWLWRNPKLSIRCIKLQSALDQEKEDNNA